MARTSRSTKKNPVTGIQGIQDRLSGASPGRWEVSASYAGRTGIGSLALVACGNAGNSDEVTWLLDIGSNDASPGASAQVAADASFIAAAKEDASWLLEQIHQQSNDTPLDTAVDLASRLAEIRNRLGAISRGQWGRYISRRGVLHCEVEIEGCGAIRPIDYTLSIQAGWGLMIAAGYNTSQGKADADFISHAPTDIPWLIGEVERPLRMSR